MLCSRQRLPANPFSYTKQPGRVQDFSGTANNGQRIHFRDQSLVGTFCLEPFDFVFSNGQSPTIYPALCLTQKEAQRVPAQGRTGNLFLRREALYPVELQAQCASMQNGPIGFPSTSFLRVYL